MITWLEMVCAVDFSESSRTTLEHAADLARRFGARLTLVHVWRGVGALPAVERPAPPPKPAGDLESELERKLDSWRVEAERLAGREVHAALLSGGPAAEVARFAAEGKADLVVVGARRRKGLERAVLGSVAEGIVRHAPCAVLVARPPQDWGD